MARIAPLPPDRLYHACDPAQFAFTTTAELEELTEIIGQARALTGEQGVLIPDANVKHLMLRQVSSRRPDEQGNLPPDSINARVAARLNELAAMRQAFAAKAGAEKERPQEEA